MRLHGIVQSAYLEENPPGSDTIELVLKVQGVGPGHPRAIVLPFELLLQDPTLDSESVEGHAFEADVDQAEGARWVVARIQFAGRRVLRQKE